MQIKSKRLRPEIDRGVVACFWGVVCRLLACLAVEPDGYGAVVGEGDLHVGTEAACADGAAEASFERADNFAVDGFGDLGTGGTDVRGTVALLRLRHQGELRDGDDVPFDVEDTAVHYTVFVVEDAQLRGLLYEVVDVLCGVVGSDADEDEYAEAVTFGYGYAADVDGCRAGALDEEAHGVGLFFGVKGGVDDAGLGGTDGGGEVVKAGGGDGLHAAKGREKLVLRLRANALDIVKARGKLTLAALVTVEGDGEAVHLRLNLLEETEGGAVVTYGNFIQGIRAEKEPCGAVAVVLHQPGHGDGEPKVGKGITYSPDLPLAPIGKDEVGKPFARFVFAETAVAACDDFAHRCIVIWPFDRADVELAIILLRGTPALEDNAGSHWVRALDVGVVKALDVQRELV